MATKTQNERLLNLLLKGLKVNGLSAWQSLGIYRLGSRIHDLRCGAYDGKRYLIQDRWIERENQFGEKVRFKEYFFETDYINHVMIERKRNEEKAHGRNQAA